MLNIKLVRARPSKLDYAASHAAVNRPAAHASPPTTTPMVPLPTVIPRTTSAHVELATAPEACADGLGTSSPLARLRSAMKNTSYTQQNAFFGAFVVFYTDEHLRRLQYISGWGGAGAGAVLAEGGAALWVPAGDVRRARETVTCAWLVIDADDPRQPTIAQWIGSRRLVGAALWVPAGDVRRARETVTCAWLVIDADDPRQPTIAQWIGAARRCGYPPGTCAWLVIDADDPRQPTIAQWIGMSFPVIQDIVSETRRRGAVGARRGRATSRETVTCAWLVIDADDPRQPTIAQWIGSHLQERLGRSGRVGGDARLASMDEWQDLSADLQRKGLQLVHIPTLVDQLWNDEMDPELKRPEFSKIVANLHNAEYTGVSWRDKVTMVRAELRAVGVDAMVVTALDEVAWLLNVRGRDLPHAPLLKAFVVVSLQDVRVYAPPGKLSMPVREVLAVYNCYTTNVNCTKVNDYTAIYTDLRRSNEWMKILIPAPGTFQRGASAAIAQSVPPAKRQVQLSPIIYLKAQKNMDEAKGMRRAHLRDAVAMCTLLSYLEGMVKKGLDELSVATKVDITRATQAGYVGVSMKTRAAFGPNGADPDYLATNMTRRRIFTNSTLVIRSGGQYDAGYVGVSMKTRAAFGPNGADPDYLATNMTRRRIFTNSTLVIRSGGQYDEGTTVVTRTVHYGIPSREERKAYTTVLRSLAALASLQTPALLPAAHVDPVARAPLWASKQDYPYPTGHGVGAALNRRE
ncbi:unnamed protein product, partial [Plutella xylostella]